MGDYLKNGVGAKIGTCGRAYYATKEMLEKVSHDPEAGYYLNPANSCFFAFPFPQFDGKQIGDISVFHTEEKDEFVVELASEGRQSFHKPLVFHKHPKGGAGLNFFCDCPYHNSDKTSRNFDGQNLKFYLKYQTYFNGELCVAGECIYCRELNIFDAEEVVEMAQNLKQRSEDYKAQGREGMSLESIKIANRLLETLTQKK